MRAPRLHPWTRVLAWLYTGPVGHGYGGVADWLTVLGRVAAARVRRR
jgi:hypothetical protein